MTEREEFSILLTSKNKRRKNIKITEQNFSIPKFKDFAQFKNQNYPVKFLKSICYFYKLKVSGNKPDISQRIYNYLYQGYYITKIQKNFRAYLITKLCKLIGPAYNNHSKCKNDADFFTVESLTDISFNEFFSYESDNNIWGFNILSIYNLFTRSTEVLNPYTRENIPNHIFNKLKEIIYINKAINRPINVLINKNEEQITQKRKNELYALELFQLINSLGNYSDHIWFTQLHKHELIRYVRELIDIWEYRAQLSQETKNLICGPYGNPFRYIDCNNLYLYSFTQLQKNVLVVIRQFITKGATQEHCSLGANYVLCALTLVSDTAAEAMPSLYWSVANNA